MRTSNKILVLFLFVLAVFHSPVYAQEKSASQPNDGEIAKQRAKEIIAKYLEITGIEIVGKKKTDLYITFDDILYLRDGMEKLSKEEVSVSFPSRMWHSSKDNLYSLLTVFDGGAYRKNYVSFGANPQSVNRNVTLSGEEQKNDQDVKLLKWETFLVFFPITIDAPWYSNLEFNHIGIAQAPDGGKADVLEASTQNRKYQLLFDVNSHLLLLWKLTSLKSDSPQETAFYFSDYKKSGDFLIAHTIQDYENGKLDSTKKITSFKDDAKLVAGLFEAK